MKPLAKALLALTAILWLAAIWIPEHCLQLILTGLLASLVASAILGQKTTR